MKRIAFFVDRINYGGGERILGLLINSFLQKKYIIDLYTYNPEWVNQNIYIDQNIHVILLTKRAEGFHKISAFFEFLRILRSNKPDAIICFHLAYSEYALWAAKLLTIPFITSERCDPSVVPSSATHRLFRNIVYRFANGVVFQTEKVKKYFSKHIQAHSCVIQNPIIDDNLPEVDLNDKSQKIIVSTGRLSPEKNFEMLIQAFSEAKTEGYKLIIYGEGPQRLKLEKLISKLKLETRVFLPGNVTRVIDQLLEADIYVLPSNNEGMPNSLIEGMAMGLACITTDFSSGGARELIKDGYNGVIIPVGNTLRLVTALNDLIAHKSYKRNIKENALKIRESNSKEIIIRKWIDYIESVIRV